ncbi:MAG TPA: CPCC family cysteine-rich protein [Kangiella sp.]
MKLEEFPQSENLEQCSCCDYFSLAERGKCLVCPVCFWEDDCCNSMALELDAPSDLNNDMTLREARNNFKKYGAYDTKFESIVISAKERATLKYKARNV